MLDNNIEKNALLTIKNLEPLIFEDKQISQSDFEIHEWVDFIQKEFGFTLKECFHIV